MALSVSRLINVNVNLTPQAAANRSFGILMIAGDSNVINGLERYRSYDGIEGVATDFGTSAPEYLAAALYFGQTPKPKTVMIGRWLKTNAAGILIGGVLSASEQQMSNWTSITTGTLTIPVDGSPVALTGLNFSAQTNLNGVATVITTAFSGAAVCTWNGSSFVITSGTTGAASSVAYGTAGTILAQMKLSSSTAISVVPGYDAETPLECATALANISTAWYGLMFNASTQPTVDEAMDVAAFIEALDVTRIFGSTITDGNVLSSLVTTDLASRLKAAGYYQSFTQYSQNAAAVASLFGRAFSVDFTQNNSTINVMYKQEPGVTAETLTTTQANVLQDKRCNVFVSYVNDTNILQYGTMAGPAYFDDIHNLDWFQNAVQTAVYNLLYTSSTKIPQTDAGVNQIVNTVAGVCQQGVTNGMIAPGVWNASPFGNLNTGDYLKTGYYIYAQPVALQSQADREARIAPPIQVAVKLAGAIDTVNITVNVNR